MAKNVPKEQAQPQLAQPVHVWWRCLNCANDFQGAKKSPKCPYCGNEVALEELNDDRVPIRKVGEKLDRFLNVDIPKVGNVASQRLGYDLLGHLETTQAYETEVWDRTLADELKEDTLERVKKKRIQSQADRLEAEKRLRQLEAERQDDQSGGGASGAGSRSPAPSPQAQAYIMDQILSLDEGDREWWLEKLKDPAVSMALSSLLNPSVQHYSNFNPYQQQMMLQNLMQRPKQDEGSGGGTTGGMMMADMAAAMGEIFRTIKEMMPQPQQQQAGVPSELKETLEQIRTSQEALKEKYYLLQFEQLKAGQNQGSAPPALSKDDLEEIIDHKLALTQKKPADLINETKQMVVALDQFRQSIQGELPEQRESLDEWRVKKEIELQADREKRAMELELKKQEKEAQRYAAVKSLLQGGFSSHLAKIASEQREQKSDEKSAPKKREGSSGVNVKLVR